MNGKAQPGQTQSARERMLLGLGLAVVALAALWWLAIAPALGTLRDADARHVQLDEQLRQMRALAQEAAQLKAMPRLESAAAQRALEQSVQQSFGSSASLTLSEGRATLTLRQASAQALAQWLAQARVNARVLPIEARLTRSGAGAASGASPAASGSAASAASAMAANPAGGAAQPRGAAPAWDGVLTLALPR